MRRPRFHRWIKKRVLEESRSKRFSLRKLAAFVQGEECRNDSLAAALLLYAHENGCLERLMSFVYDDALRAEYKAVEGHLGQRPIERLALRDTPMYSLPDAYRGILEEYKRAYHAPERIASEKQTLREQAHDAVLRSGASPAELARALGLDRANLNAYLTRGEIHRLTLADAKRLAMYTAS